MFCFLINYIFTKKNEIMNLAKDSKLLDDFNLSVILPFYKKFKEFEIILTFNCKYFQRNGIEVILVIDEPTEKELVLNLISQYPFINWVVIVNDTSHQWRNPAKVINVGIKNSSKDYIMVCSPESKFFTDAIFLLRKAAELYDPCFVTGAVHFATFNTGNEINLNNPLKYGSILVKKEYLEKANGYSEMFESWGGEDDNIRTKLSFLNIKKIHVPEAILVHYEEKLNGRVERHNKSRSINIEARKRALYLCEDDLINESWGTDFDNKVFDYKVQNFGYNVCFNYLTQFLQRQIYDRNIFSQHFRVVALIQTHNEISNIKDILTHLEETCDGIILLDDESTDGTYECAESKNLLIKIKKKRKGFNDLENRNILLDVASFINSEWLFFIDADERLILKDKNFIPKECEKFKAFCFYLVHLWDSEDEFRADLQEASPIREPGILHRWRMFKSIGHLQINSIQKLHFKATPYVSFPTLILPVVIVHHGMKLYSTRKRKYENYLMEDKDENKKKYDYFLDTEISTRDLKVLESINLLQKMLPGR